jgi:farnesol dehydrogenase
VKVFVTGGTGFIGSRLTERLLSENNDVVVLTRNPSSMASLTGYRVSIIKGDILNKALVTEGMKGCEIVFHLAAYTRPWADNPDLVSEINVKGTLNVLEAAAECGVKRVVVTSTAATMAFSNDGKPADESIAPDLQFNTLYSKTKVEAEKTAIEFFKKGLDVVIVNPSRVYGPGKDSKSNSVTKIIRLYMKGIWRIIPGDGESIGNYVFIDDVVEGLMLAASSGRPGERYILGGTNLSFNELFTIIEESSGKRRRLVKLPKVFLRKIIIIMSFITKITGIPPLITMDWFEKYMKNASLSSAKAIRELGYRITPAGEGISKTIEWLRLNNKGL